LCSPARVAAVWTSHQTALPVMIVPEWQLGINALFRAPAWGRAGGGESDLDLFLLLFLFIPYHQGFHHREAPDLYLQKPSLEPAQFPPELSASGVREPTTQTISDTIRYLVCHSTSQLNTTICNQHHHPYWP
jgi:hypothetical protein